MFGSFPYIDYEPQAQPFGNDILLDSYFKLGQVEYELQKLIKRIRPTGVRKDFRKLGLGVLKPKTE